MKRGSLLELTLKPKPPFDFDLTVKHMHVLPPGHYSGGVYVRAIKLSSSKVVRLSINSKGTAERPQLAVLIESDAEMDEVDEREIAEKVTFMFSLQEELEEFYSLTEEDPVLKYAKEDLYGLKIQTVPTFFEGMVIGFCAQWVSFSRAIKMLDKLIERLGERRGEDYLFPSPETLAGASTDELKECGLGFRAERVKWLSMQVAEGELELEGLIALPDDQVREELMKIKWVGPWTAEALLLWRLKRPDAFPIDVWSAKVFRAFYPQIRKRSPEEIKEFATKRWGNQRGLAFYYLMCDRENLSKKFGVSLR